MNNIITIDQFVTLLGEKTGLTREQAREYTTEFQAQIITCLKQQGVAEIPYLGKLLYRNGKIQLTLNEEQAAIINEPFEFFESVALVPDLDVEKLETVIPTKDEPKEDAVVADENVEDVINNGEIIPEGEVPVEEVRTEDAKETGVEPEEIDSTSIQINTSSTSPQVDPVGNSEAETEEYDEGSRSVTRNVLYYVSGLVTGMVLTCIAVYFLYPPMYHDDMTDTTVDIIETETPSIKTEPQDTLTAASINTDTDIRVAPVIQAEITDTVTPTYFLASMARKYYGRMEFWVYIYKENESELGHPDRIPSGTVVRIPDLKKAGIDVHSDEAVKKAQSLSEDIFSKWR